MPVADIAHGVGRTVLLVIGMQDEKDIQRVFGRWGSAAFILFGK